MNGVPRGPQSGLDTCRIAVACYWVAISKFFSRSVALAVEHRSLKRQWQVKKHNMNMKQRVLGVLRGPQSAFDTCSIAVACCWIAMSKFFSRSVALAVERRSFYSNRLLSKYHQGDVEVMSSNVVGPRLTYFLGTIPSAVCQ